MAEKTNTATGLGYSGDLVWQADKDRFLTMGFTPADRQPDLLALYAFNVEVAKTAEVTSEPMIGEIRLQWWRDAIEEIYQGEPRKHEVVLSLAEVIKRHDLPRDLFDSLIDARTFDLYPENFETHETQADYIDHTAGHLARLTTMVLGGSAEDGEIAAQAGRVWGRLGLLRALGFNATRQRYFHLDEAAGQDIALGQLTPNVQMLIAAEREAIASELDCLRGQVRSLSRKAMPGVLPLALAGSYLKRIKADTYDPFQKNTDMALFRKQWLMWWASKRRKL